MPIAKKGQEAVRAMDALRRIVQLLRSSALHVERDVGISGAQLFVLGQIGAAPGQSIGQLSARTATRQSTVSEVVARLAELRLVARGRAREDARRVVLSLTPRGRALLDAAPGTAQADLVTAFGELPASVQRALAGGLERWSASAGLAEEPSMFFEGATTNDTKDGSSLARRRPAREGAAARRGRGTATRRR